MQNSKSIETVARQIQQVDWDFSDTVSHKYSSNALHWYPGTFVPQIPSYLVQMLSSPGAMVLDPFAGSGTTGFEAARLSRKAILIDRNPASISVMRGKLAVVSGRSSEVLLRCLDRFAFGISITTSPAHPTSAGQNPKLEKWFHKETLSQLRRIWGMIEAIEDQYGRDALEMIFSDVLFSCASTSGSKTRTGGTRRHHWGWIADNVHPPSDRLVCHDAFRVMHEKTRNAIDVARHYQTLAVAPEYMSVTKADARALPISDQSVDLIVTAPPYVSMIDYTLANRLIYLWMNWDLESERVPEIGARYRRKRAAAATEYLSGMDLAIEEMFRVLRPGGFVALVVGASRVAPFVANAVMELARRRFSAVRDPVTRRSTHRRISERQGSETLEIIGVFTK